MKAETVPIPGAGEWSGMQYRKVFLCTLKDLSISSLYLLLSCIAAERAHFSICLNNELLSLPTFPFFLLACFSFPIGLSSKLNGPHNAGGGCTFPVCRKCPSSKSDEELHGAEERRTQQSPQDTLARKGRGGVD